MSFSIFSPSVINNNHSMFFSIEIIFSAILQPHHSVFNPHPLFFTPISLVHQEAKRNRVYVGGGAMLIKQYKKNRHQLVCMEWVELSCYKLACGRQPGLKCISQTACICNKIQKGETGRIGREGKQQGEISSQQIEIIRRLPAVRYI